MLKKEKQQLLKNPVEENKGFERHFRKYKKSGHPAYIVDEENEDFIFHRVTSSEKSGHHKNWKVEPNPDKNKKTPMYIVKQEQQDRKKHFDKEPLKYNADLPFIKRHKKK